MFAVVTDHELSMWILAGVGAGIIASATAFWRVAVYTSRRFVDEDSGIIPRWRRESRQEATDTATRHERQLAMCQDHGGGLVQLSKTAVSSHEVLIELRDISANTLEATRKMTDWHEDDGNPVNASMANESLADLARAEKMKLEACDLLESSDVERIKAILDRVIERGDA